jgi:hypothetical protein
MEPAFGVMRIGEIPDRAGQGRSDNRESLGDGHGREGAHG